MQFSRYIIALILSVAATIAATAQQVRFDNIRHEFGSVIWHTPCQVSFKIYNDGTAPLTLTDVETDCGCTVAQWSREPIAPGAAGVITATFDAELLGHFEKQVLVFTDAAEEPYTLTLSGDVVRERKGEAENFPYHIGDIYLDTDNVEFDNVRKGDMPVKVINVFNAGRLSLEPELMHLPKYLTATADPQVIRPGRTGRLYLTLNSELLRSYGLTQTNVYVSRFPGDRVNRNNEVFVSITLLPEQTYNTESQLAIAPRATLDSLSIDMGRIGNKKKLSREVTLTNTGRSPLKVTALQVYNPGLGVSLNKRTLEPGESAKIKIKVSRDADHFKGRRRVLLITNDPVNPKIIIDITVKK